MADQADAATISALRSQIALLEDDVRRKNTIIYREHCCRQDIHKEIAALEIKVGRLEGTIEPEGKE